jgi:hypothetical protein
MVVLVAALLVVMQVMGFASAFTGSATGRAYGRAVDTRRVLDGAEAAIAEAVAVVRRDLDAGRRPVPTRVAPVVARAVFSGLSIGEVAVAPVSTHAGPPEQGVLEMSVAVGGAQTSFKVRHTVRQRRVWFVARRPAVLGRGEVVKLLAHPLGTVIE